MSERSKYIGAVLSSFITVAGCEAVRTEYTTLNRDGAAKIDLNKPDTESIRSVLDKDCGPGVDGNIRYIKDGDQGGGTMSETIQVVCKEPEKTIEQVTVTEELPTQYSKAKTAQQEGGRRDVAGHSVIVDPNTVEPNRSAEITLFSSSSDTQARRTTGKYTTPADGLAVISRTTTTRIVESNGEREVIKHEGSDGYSNRTILGAVATGAGIMGAFDAAGAFLLRPARTQLSSSPHLRGGDQTVKVINPQKKSWSK